MDQATDEVRALRERVERIERKARWLVALVTVSALLCVALLVWQFAPLDSIVEARGFTLRDEGMRVRAELRLNRDGSPVLRLRNRAGRSGAVLQLREDGVVALRLFDTAQVERAELRLDEHGTPSVTLSGPDGGTRVRLAAEESGEAGRPRIVLRDRVGRTVWSAPASAGGAE